MEYVVGALAVWRLSSMIAYERGPFALFRFLRSIARIPHFDDDTPDSDSPPNEFAKLLLCVWCSSPWLAAGWLAFYSRLPEVTMIASYILAFSAVAVLLDQVNG